MVASVCCTGLACCAVIYAAALLSLHHTFGLLHNLKQNPQLIGQVAAPACCAGLACCAVIDTAALLTLHHTCSLLQYMKQTVFTILIPKVEYYNSQSRGQETTPIDTASTRAWSKDTSGKSCGIAEHACRSSIQKKKKKNFLS